MGLIYKFNCVPLLTLLITFFCRRINSFSSALVIPKSINVLKSCTKICRDNSNNIVAMAMYKDEKEELLSKTSSNSISISSRSQFFSSVTKAAVLSSTALFIPTKINALEEETTASTSNSSKKMSSITSCPTKANSNKNCVSTSNIKQIEYYLSPWTFECSPGEAFARLKGVLVSEPFYVVTDIDVDSKYIKVETKRGTVFDEMEFLVNSDDKVVVFRSGEKIINTGNTDDEDSGSFLTDFRANRNRMEFIRKKGGVFDVMGSDLSGDSYYGSPTGGNGVLGQLKAFYGLQSGKGFEEVVLDY